MKEETKNGREHTNAIQAMEKCIDAVTKWMIQDRLMINDDKTEFLLVGTRQQLEIRVP